MKKKLKVGIVGGTGMVGQRFVQLLENHPWFEVTAIAASPKSAGKTYEEAVRHRWKMSGPIPERVKSIVVQDASNVEEVSANVDFVFCAVEMKKEETKALEEAYAKAGTPVVSNNSAHRWTPDVPVVIPEVNPEHLYRDPGTAQAARHVNRIYRGQAELLHPKLRAGASRTCAVQAHKGRGFHLPGHFRSR